MSRPAKSCTGRARGPSVIHTSAPCGRGAPLVGVNLSRARRRRSGTQGLLTPSRLILKSMQHPFKKKIIKIKACSQKAFFPVSLFSLILFPFLVPAPFTTLCTTPPLPFLYFPVFICCAFGTSPRFPGDKGGRV